MFSDFISPRPRRRRPGNLYSNPPPPPLFVCNTRGTLKIAFFLAFPPFFSPFIPHFPSNTTCPPVSGKEFKGTSEVESVAPPETNTSGEVKDGAEWLPVCPFPTAVSVLAGDDGVSLREGEDGVSL
eukprot:Hpha_TRINITY_DN15049_c0_g1::TRINITY_DN15049_c0_g1_i11::g.123208::m.123208